MGPTAYAKHLISGPRLPFTAAYFGSLGLSLYFSLGWLAPCHHVWGEEGSGMDVGLKKVLTTK
ncbi:hypothetical protein COL940_011751 [Colletotrichum noveboracense]|nr:hypothetical protein COL940_011751 [Colletotrichum noveboracense]